MGSGERATHINQSVYAPPGEQTLVSIK